MRALRSPIVITFAIALIVRVLYVLSIRDAVFFDHLQTEPAHYDAWARAIVDGAAPMHLPFDEAPGYPYFLALVYALGGGVLAACLVQALLGAAACAAIAEVARRLASARAAWIAGAFAACYGPFIYFTGQLEPAVLAVAAVAGALVATPTTPDASRRRWLLAGAAWALAVVIRTELVLAAPVILLHAWRLAGRRAALHALAVPVLLVALAFTANTLASGHPVVLATGSGVNLWLGNNPDADGVNPFVHGPLEDVVRDVEASSPDPVDRDAAFRAHAELSLPLLAKKLVWTFSRRELPNAADISWQTAQSWVFQPPVFPIGFGVLLPLAAAGAMGARRREAIALAGPALAGLAACVVFFTNARFRLVMAPSLIVLAALAIDAVVRGSTRARILAAVGLLSGIALAWPSYWNVGHYRVAQIDFNTASLELAAGHPREAAMYLRSGLAREPRDPAAWMELARVLDQLGDHAGAMAARNSIR